MRLLRRDQVPPSIRSSLRTVFTTFVVLLILLGLAGVAMLLVARAGIDNIVDTLQPLANADRQAEEEVSEAQVYFGAYLASGGDDKIKQGYEAARTAYATQMAHAQDLALTLGETQVIRLLTAERAAGDHFLYGQSLDTVGPPGGGPPAGPAPATSAPPTPPPGAQQPVLLPSGLRITERLRMLQGYWTAHADTQQTLTTMLRHSHNLLDTLIVLEIAALAVLVGVSVAVSVLATRRTLRTVIGPLGRVAETMARLRAGDMSARAAINEPEHLPVELSHVTRALDDLAADNERLHRQDEGRLSREQQVRDIARRIRSAISLDDVLAGIVAEAGQALGADVAVVRVAAGTAGAAWARPGAPAGARDVHPDLLHALTGDEIVVADDLSADPVIWAAAEHRLGAALGVPLSAADKILGHLVLLMDGRTYAWPDSGMALLVTLAPDIASAIEHAQLYDRERGMVHQLQELDWMKDDFVSAVSHELRTPLTSIIGYLELLSDGSAGKLAPLQAEAAVAIERNSMRLLALIDDLLSRLESAAVELHREAVPVGELIRKALRAALPQLSTRQLAVTVSADDDPGTITGDGRHLQRVLTNLLDNAIKFTPDGGAINISATRQGELLLLRVRDTGIGISQQDQDRLFSRFFRAGEGSRHSARGSGLGLTVSRAIVEAHGGTIQIDSSPGAGTTVTVVLPNGAGDGAVNRAANRGIPTARTEAEMAARPAHADASATATRPE